MSDRPMRPCDLCGGFDDHPRHVVDNTQIRHHDCCAAAGCAICQATEEANGGLRGNDLIAKVTAVAVVED